MEFWLKTSLLLCLYGFFKQLRPSEPFLTEYLLGPFHNLTESQVYYDVYPVWTYSYLCLLVAVFLLTDLLRYKPVIVCEAVGYVVTWSLLLWARGVRWMQLMQFFYGTATSTEVAYYTYIYAQVDGRYYQRVTSYTRCAILAGTFLSGVLSQVFYSTGLLDEHSLNYISLTSVSIALCVAILLPPVKTSIYFHREAVVETNGLAISRSERAKDADGEGGTTHLHSNHRNYKSFAKYVKRVASFLWRDFRDAYKDRYLLKWSIWWAFATCINYQVGNYIQPLWESVAPFQETEAIYNGAVEAASTLIGALAAFGIGYLHLNWSLVGELILAIISFLDAILLILIGFTEEIWVAYSNYIAFRVSYQILITVSSYQVAKGLRADSYGLVFGFNMFISLLLQSILTLIVIQWLETEPGAQFVIYGCYFGCLSLLFFLFAFYNISRLGVEGIRRQGLWAVDAFTPTERDEPPIGTTELY